jgi:hypothetical protein
MNQEIIAPKEPEHPLVAFFNTLRYAVKPEHEIELEAAIETVGELLNIAEHKKLWVNPLNGVPAQHEIVVIACDVMIVSKDELTPDAREVHKIFQTAIYERTEDNQERWHCGQPFITLHRWMSLPPLALGSIQQVKRKLLLPNDPVAGQA